MTWLQWTFIFVVLWLGFDVIVIATIWGFTRIAQSRFPDWWRRIIIDRDPSDY